MFSTSLKQLRDNLLRNPTFKLNILRYDIAEVFYASDKKFSVL